MPDEKQPEYQAEFRKLVSSGAIKPREGVSFDVGKMRSGLPRANPAFMSDEEFKASRRRSL